MAITTLLSIMLIGGSAVQQKTPTIIDINTKCYVLANTSFKAEGKKISTKTLGGGDSVTLVEGFDEGKLIKQSAAIIHTAPTIRTLDGQKASLTYTRNYENTPLTVFNLGYLATVKRDGNIGLDLTFKEEIAEGNETPWTYSARAIMGADSKAWLIKRKSVTHLYIVKASVVDPSNG